MADRRLWQSTGPVVRALEHLLTASAALLLSAVGIAAWADVSQAWDVWYYHLPFAARLLGIVPAEAYVFSSGNAARYAGFPLGAEILQGVLWRVTGRPEGANLVAFGSVVGFVAFLARRFGVRWSHATLGVLGVPLVMTHASAAYVDLPANVCAAGLVLVVADRSRPIDTRAVLCAVAFACGAAHMRFQLAPIVALALLGVAWRSAPRDRLIVAASAPVVFFWPLKNLFVHANPVFPVELVVGPLRFPGVDTPYASSPVWLEHAPRPLRFAASVLELGLPSFSNPRRWTVDQWTPPDHDGYRMGGFFGAYVLVLLIALVVFTARSPRGSVARHLARGLAALTLVVSVLPQSHELRYYLVWMLVLVASAHVVAPARARPLLAVAGLASALVVIAVTRAAYVTPAGDSFRELVDKKVGRAREPIPQAGARLCVHDPPWTFLHAARFQPTPAAYVVVEAEDDGACPPGALR